MTTLSPVESLLGRPPSPLGLRICGTDRDGQVVWLNSPRVTIGSGRGNTLRLRAPGVTPLHCVILRGSQHTIARCWSPDTRFNGAAFDTAHVQAGDRLGLGPLEFEVVEQKAESRKQTAGKVQSELAAGILPAVESPIGAAELARNAEATQKYQRLANRYKLSRRQGQRRIRKLAIEMRAMFAKAAELEGRLAEHRSNATQDETRLAEWEAQRCAIDDQRQQWGQTQAQIEQVLSELNRRSEMAAVAAAVPAVMSAPANNLFALEHETNAQREKLDAERAVWESDRAIRESELSARQAALRVESERLDRIQANVERQQAILEQQLESLSQRQTLLETRGDESAKLQQATEEQRRTLRAEVEKFDNQRSQFATEQEEFEKLRTEWEHSRAELTEATAQLQCERQDLDAERSMVDVQRQELAGERQRLQEEQQRLNADKQTVETRLGQIAEAEEQISQARSELTRTERDLDDRISRQAIPPEAPTMEFTDDAASPDEEVGPKNGAPVDNSHDLFARLRALNIIKEEKERDDARSEESPPGDRTSLDEQSTFPSTQVQSPESPTGSDNEESIEDYMARLLKRVGRGVATGQNVASVAPSEQQRSSNRKSDPVTSELCTSASADEDEVESPLISLSDLHARTSAPEKTRDLAAMREIANFTARTAIAKHAWRSRVVRQLKRFMLGIVALTCGFALVLLAPTFESHYFLCGAAAIAAALLWFLPSIHRARRCKKQGQKAQHQAEEDYENRPPQTDEGIV